MISSAAHFLVRDDGQDLVEYALLTACIGLASVAVLDLISLALRGTYTAWDGGINGLWEPSAPGR